MSETTAPLPLVAPVVEPELANLAIKDPFTKAREGTVETTVTTQRDPSVAPTESSQGATYFYPSPSTRRTRVLNLFSFFLLILPSLRHGSANFKA